MQPNNEQVVVVGGGWSLDETFEELQQLYWSGAKVVALNGAGHWLEERGVRVSAIVVMDARPFNARFIEGLRSPNCKVFLASQCAPELFDVAEGRETYIYHVLSTDTEAEKAILDGYYVNNWHGVPGTCCVAFRALCLFRLLGFQKFHIFGVDSCYRDDGKHHAYSQPENDAETTAKISVGGREFLASGWQVNQAVWFMELVKKEGSKFDLAFYGDGMIAHMVRTGAAMERKNGC